jgi:phosphoserine/homoserine phosphotransferase
MIACLDLEGVLVPEIWINVAESTGIEALRITTRDEPDYDKLMRNRIAILEQHGLKLADIQAVIRRMGPLEGAHDFLSRLRAEFKQYPVGTFYEFAAPLMEQLITRACSATAGDRHENRVRNYQLRLPTGSARRSWRSSCSTSR